MQGSSTNGTKMRNYQSLGKAARAYNPGTTEAETGRSPGWKTAWALNKNSITGRGREGERKREHSDKQGGWGG